MSVIQSTQKEVRFLKRKNLEEEARIYGNMLADQIRMYGIDCIYHKLNTDVFGNFKGIIDKNTILKNAYGYNISPDYSCSAEMITFPEMQQDIFQLQKFGMKAEAEVDFNFDAKQFACDLATKCGQLKEYPIKEIDIVCEVPEHSYHYEQKEIYDPEKMISSIVEVAVDDVISVQIGDRIYEANANEGKFPYSLGLGYNEMYECGILTGKLSIEIDEYEYDKEYTIVCNPYEHTDFKVEFPKNSDLYKSLTYEICNDDYLETMIFLTYKIHKTKVGTNQWKSILTGKIHGGILFFDINKLGKYLELIHPEVGDIITIDFPDDNNRERYEITDCYEKSLQSDGISPLLHKYIWKCKARRHVDSYDDEDLENNEANARLEEKLKYDQVISEEIAKKISKYDKISDEANDDAVYGGYDGVIEEYDHMKPDPNTNEKYNYIDDGTCIDIIRFGCGSRLVTNGYDLIFIQAPIDENNAGDGYLITMLDHDPDIGGRAYFESGLRWLKATEDKIVFVNIEGIADSLAENEVATQNQIQICLNDMNQKTLDDININEENQNFLKFKGCKSYIFATREHLFAKIDSNKELYKLV